MRAKLPDGPWVEVGRTLGDLAVPQGVPVGAAELDRAARQRSGRHPLDQHAVGIDRIIAEARVAKATFYHPGYRGCPFVNAAAEYPDPAHPVRQAIAQHRRWFRDLLRNLLVADGHPDAERAADLLVALKDVLLVGADLDDPTRRDLIREAVIRLLDGPAHVKTAARAT